MGAGAREVGACASVPPASRIDGVGAANHGKGDAYGVCRNARDVYIEKRSKYLGTIDRGGCVRQVRGSDVADDRDLASGGLTMDESQPSTVDLM